MDVTEQVRQREQLLETERTRARLAEALTSEIAHRTKNNLAIVAGLLQVQLGRESAASAPVALIRDAIARILSFSTMHEQMSERHSDAIELLDALRRIAETDGDTLSSGNVRIAVEGEPFECPSGVATNLCVVANELLTNAIKHGGTAEGPHHVEVRLGCEQGQLRLTVWSAGNPLAAEFDVRERSRMGLSLVRAVVEQLGGSFSLSPDGGGTLACVLIDEGRLRKG
jgi:two-component sensor histidine kinase